MPRVGAFELPGIDCRSYSSDHGPPHFHARRRGHWEYRVYFLAARERMLEHKWGQTMSARDRRDLAEAAETKRLTLLEEWNAKVQHDD